MSQSTSGSKQQGAGEERFDLHQLPFLELAQDSKVYQPKLENCLVRLP